MCKIVHCSHVEREALYETYPNLNCTGIWGELSRDLESGGKQSLARESCTDTSWYFVASPATLTISENLQQPETDRSSLFWSGNCSCHKHCTFWPYVLLSEFDTFIPHQKTVPAIAFPSANKHERYWLQTPQQQNHPMTKPQNFQWVPIKSITSLLAVTNDNIQSSIKLVHQN